MYESQNVTLGAGALPLRFLSFVVTGHWVFLIARERNENVAFNVLVMAVAVPVLYMGISAFLTFRPPGKLLLLLLGIVGNIPVILLSLLALAVYCRFPKLQEFLILFIICWAFVTSWAIFVRARFDADTSESKPLSILPDKQDWRARNENRYEHVA